MKTPVVIARDPLVSNQGTSIIAIANLGSKQLKEDAVTGWTYREINWYLAEDRLLFASDSELEVHKWDLLFQWLLGKDKQ